jgi:hypothetical protein
MTNFVNANFSVVAGGTGSFVSGSNDCGSFIGAGRGNIIQGQCNYGSQFSAIVAGDRNCITGASSSFDGNNFIGSGQLNRILDNGHNSSIVGGFCNLICTATTFGRSTGNTVLGGFGNKISGSTNFFNNNTISGHLNCITSFLSASNQVTSSINSGKRGSNAIIGGVTNCIHEPIGNITNEFGYNFIGGGRTNKICNNLNSPLGNLYANAIIGSISSTISGSTSSAIIGSRTNNRIVRHQASAIIGGCSICLCGFQTNVVVAALCNKAISGSSHTFYTCNVCAYGSLTKNTGTFKIDHPNPELCETHDLYHSFVESPTAGDNLYRFTVTTVDNEAEVILPEYYRYLNTDSQLWISADGHFGKAFALINISATKIKVTSNEDGKYNILLVGTRKDKDAVAAWKGAERLKK